MVIKEQIFLLFIMPAQIFTKKTGKSCIIIHSINYRIS